MESALLPKRASWKKPAAVLVALLLVVGIIGAAVVNKERLNAPMEVDGLTAEADMGDVVAPLVTGQTASEHATAQADETVMDEPAEDEFVVDDDAEAVPKNEDEDVELVLADDGMKDGEFEDEVAELGPDETEADFKKVAEDSRRRYVKCARRCRYVRRCYRVKAGDRNNDDRDDFRRICRRRRICSCVRRGRYLCRRRCRRRCFNKRVRVCRRRRYRRCRRYRRRLRRSSDDYYNRYFTRCSYYYRTRCGYQTRRVCRNRCNRICSCRCLSGSASK